MKWLEIRYYKLVMDCSIWVLHLAIDLKSWAFITFNRALKDTQRALGEPVTLDIDEIENKELKRRVQRKRDTYK